MCYYKTDIILGFIKEGVSLKKGSKKKLEIQQVTKELIIEKGYPAVTMADIGQRLHLSTGGLYYHYHSLEEIFWDIVANETKDVWSIFSNVNNIDDLIHAFKTYFQVEKRDLLNFDHTLNSILYQYYFSFSVKERTEKMQSDYTSTLGSIYEILKKVYKTPQIIERISNHIYVVLHGLNLLAMTGQLTSTIIDDEFNEIETLLHKFYSESEKTHEL